MSVGSVAIPFDHVHIIGTGLLGTSVGLALREHGVTVTLEDSSPTTVSLAADYGAGQPADQHQVEPALVVVATPPDVTATVVASALARFPHALVIDVASVKGSILGTLGESRADLSRYVGTHPMAGRERGGPTAARVDLFTGRPWIICPHENTSPDDVSRLKTLIDALGATALEMSAEQHDRAVAVISHLPQVVSSVLASSLLQTDSKALELAGQGIRDVTRIAASDPAMWTQILSHNSAEVSTLLNEVGTHLSELAKALSDLSAPGAQKSLAKALHDGNEGVSRLPGKHGGSARFVSITVVIDDRPGQLAQLLTDVGELGVNLEDMRLEHSPGAAVGFVELFVLPDSVAQLERDLAGRGWPIAGEKQ